MGNVAKGPGHGAQEHGLSVRTDMACGLPVEAEMRRMSDIEGRFGPRKGVLQQQASSRSEDHRSLGKYLLEK